MVGAKDTNEDIGPRKAIIGRGCVRRKPAILFVRTDSHPAKVPKFLPNSLPIAIRQHKQDNRLFSWSTDMIHILLAGMTLAFLTADPPAEEKWHPVVEYLSPGKWSEGEKRLSQSISDDEIRFGLGILRIFTSFEHLAKGLYDYGFLSQYAAMGGEDRRAQMLHPDPKPINDRQAGDLIRGFIQDLEAAEATLADVKDVDVKLRIPVGRLLREYQTSFGENPLIGFLPISPRRFLDGADEPQTSDAEKMVVVFDKADVTWFRGYCHIVLALSETLVACDWKEWFDRSAHLIFPKVDGPYPFLAWNTGSVAMGMAEVNVFLDLPAVIAKADAPVTQPQRLKRAHQHLLAVLTLSRQMWNEVQAETDNDAEWIPGPNQTSAMGASVSKEMVATWLKMLDELEAILKGELLLPFWRGDEPRGFNLKRVFDESKRISVVDWLQGVAAAPFLEDGPIAEGTIWRNLFEVFGDDFFGYALWFN